MTNSEPKLLIDLNELLAHWPKWARLWFFPIIDRFLGTKDINQIHQNLVYEAIENKQVDALFFRRALGALSVRYEVEADAFAKIPTEGPLLVVSNHPYGALDGIVLGEFLKGLRPDSLLMANFLLANIEGMSNHIIQVDPFERPQSKKANTKGIRLAMAHLKKGGCLGVFPAGEVSSFKIKHFHIADKAWTPHIAQLALKTEAKVLPIFFEGHNSFSFQLLGLLHPRLRTAMLARELLKMRSKSLRLRIGKAITHQQLKAFKTDEAATEFLRLHTYALGQPNKAWDKLRKLQLPYRFSALMAQPKAVVEPINPELLEAEIAKLPKSCTLLEEGDFSIYCAEYKQIPNLIQEIGRLREITFREVGEGTGKSTDLDQFDTYYRHLFMWNRKEKELVGAYRIGLVDEIVSEHGVSGLYTRTLFRFKLSFIKKMGKALELGRSFIQPKYQRKHSALALIWKGIGRFVVLNPDYKTLFGPVSISDTYHTISKNLMLHFLKEHNFNSELTQLIRPLKPPRTPESFRGTSLSKIGKSVVSVEGISALVAGFERDEKGIPTLLKHYLKLNGVLLSFNVDPAFSHVVDGLIMVDLTKTEQKLLARFLTQEGVETFLKFHDRAAETHSDLPH